MDDKQLEKRFIFFSKLYVFILQLMSVLFVSLFLFQIFTNSRYLSSISFPLIVICVFVALFLKLIQRFFLFRIALQERTTFLIVSSILISLLIFAGMIILIWPFIRNIAS